MKSKTFQMPSAMTVAFGLIALSSLALPSVSFAKEFKEFNNQSVKGGYSIFLNGWVAKEASVNYPSGLVPTWSVGVFRADGDGNLSKAEATLNVGGFCIVQLTGSGTYSVNKNGTGSASAKLSLKEPIPDCWTTRRGGDSMKFDLNFAINKETLEIVGTVFENLKNQVPVDYPFRFGASGQARPQTAMNGRPRADNSTDDSSAH